MKGLPEKLKDVLMEVGAKHAADAPHLQSLAMAMPIISCYLGEPWYVEHVCFHEPPDSFTRNERGAGQESLYLFQNRVGLLADALFQLRDCKNFEVLCERFQERDTKPCFAEAVIASLFSKFGFDVEIVRETGVKGDDFDFIVRKDLREISVEVTAKDTPILTEATIRNTLRKKRGQVPNNRPAILYMSIPEEWTYAGDKALRCLSNAIESHFRNSKTFNAVVAVWHAKVELMDFRVFVFTSRTYEHPLPRYPAGDLSILRRSVVGIRGDLHSVRRRAQVDPEGFRRVFSEGHGETPPSFVEWYENALKGG